MNVLILKTLATPGKCYKRGRIEVVDDAMGESWIRSGIAEATDELNDEQADMWHRFYHGQFQPCLFLPFVGEFGHQIMHHVRFVHFHTASDKVVCCRPGDEVLYPRADEFITDWVDPIPDERRAGSGRMKLHWDGIEANYPNHVPVECGNLSHWQEFHCPIFPEQKINLKPKIRNLKADVVLGIRHREFCPEKNWPRWFWQMVADGLKAEGYTVAVAGKRPHTHDIDGQLHHSSDYPDTDAAVELIQNCRLYIGTDTGVSHLASLIGCPMLLWREEVQQFRDYIPRMIDTNEPHPVTVLTNVWRDPKRIIATAVNLLRQA